MNKSKKFFIVLSLFSFLSFSALQVSAMPPSQHHGGFEQRNHYEKMYQVQYKRPPRVDVNYNYNYGYSYRTSHQSTTGAVITGGILGGLIGALIGASL